MADQTIRKLAVFRAPGYPYQDDKLTAGQTGVWSDIIDTWMTEEINAEYRDDDGNMHPLPGPRKPDCDGKPRTMLKQFFNGRITPYNVGQKPTPITWIGFPRLVRSSVAVDLSFVTLALTCSSDPEGDQHGSRAVEGGGCSPRPPRRVSRVDGEEGRGRADPVCDVYLRGP